MVSSLLSMVGCLECLELHLGVLVALPLRLPGHLVQPLAGPIEGDDIPL